MKPRISVLVVEKSQTFSMYLALLLHRMGFKSLRVDDYETAKEILSRGIIDILIVGDQGEDEPISKIIKSLILCVDRESVPVIAISKSSDPANKTACYEAGCHSYLLKPIQPRQLHSALYSKITPPSERRTSLRCRVNLGAEISVENDVFEVFQIESLSKGGALVSCEKNIPIGTEININFVISNKKINLNSMVMYIQGDSSGGQLNIGVKFVNIDSNSEYLIDQFVEKTLTGEN